MDSFGRFSLIFFLGLLSLHINGVCVDAGNSENDEFDVPPDFSRVTCRSVIKLTNQGDLKKLHSHSINYGSGSGQQSVTSFEGNADPNSYWVVLEGFEENSCIQGASIKCGSKVRLQHLDTQTFLHSHLHVSPLSRQQEVSAYPFPGDTGDTWKVACLSSFSGTKEFWERDEPVRFVHVDTGKLLHSSGKNYPKLPGQGEITGFSKKSKDNIWKAEEGLYFPVIA